MRLIESPLDPSRKSFKAKMQIGGLVYNTAELLDRQTKRVCNGDSTIEDPSRTRLCQQSKSIQSSDFGVLDRLPDFCSQPT